MKLTSKIRVLDETWRVPYGFGATYRRMIDPPPAVSEVIGLLALVGYHATPDQVASWDLRRRVEAVVYAGIEYARASDNPVRCYPRPSWLPKIPWKGPPVDVSRIRKDLRGAFAGPSGTPIVEDAR